MASRFTILPDDRFVLLRGALDERLASVGNSVRPENFAALCDGMMRYVLEQSFFHAGAHGGLIWLLDESQEFLVPAFGIGAVSEQLVLQHQQPIREGIVSMVMMSEQPFCENEVYKNAKHSKIVDSKLQQQTYAMIVVPFYFLRQCRGVISCVKIQPADADPPISMEGFSSDHLKIVQRAAAVLTELIDYKLLRQTIHW
jgi:hypothetical protein